jgi:phytoene dehydrogenase-like protein
MNVPFTDMLGYFIKDAVLKKMLSVLHHYICDDISNINTLTMLPLFGYYMHGGYYPRGGSQAFADALAEVIVERGGEILLHTPVSHILIEHGRAAGIETAGHEIIRSEAVISNADVRRTFLELVGREQVESYFYQRIERLRPSDSAFMVSLGIDFVPDIEPVTLVIMEDRTLAVMAPSIVDPSLAPSGHACINLLTLIPHEEAASWKRGEPGYGKRKEQFGDRLIALAEEAIPDLRAHIVYRQDASPATFGRYAWTTDGAVYGLAAGEWRPSIKTPVQGLYLVGAGAAVRPGVGDAVYTGMIAADAVLKEEGHTKESPRPR